MCFSSQTLTTHTAFACLWTVSRRCLWRESQLRDTPASVLVHLDPCRTLIGGRLRFGASCQLLVPKLFRMVSETPCVFEARRGAHFRRANQTGKTSARTISSKSPRQKKRRRERLRRFFFRAFLQGSAMIRMSLTSVCELIPRFGREQACRMQGNNSISLLVRDGMVECDVAGVATAVLYNSAFHRSQGVVTQASSLRQSF